MKIIPIEANQWLCTYCKQRLTKHLVNQGPMTRYFTEDGRRHLAVRCTFEYQPPDSIRTLWNKFKEHFDADPTEKAEMKIGDRVGYSVYGIEQMQPHKKNKDRLGTVTNKTDGELVTVIWDGTKTKQRFHKSFLRVIESEGA